MYFLQIKKKKLQVINYINKDYEFLKPNSENLEKLSL